MAHIDGYIHKVKQVAALLDYGEPQVLELFKNTLSSILYYLLYLIDNLNAMIETAKRMLTKEKIDKQKTSQSSTTPFMKASQDKSKKSEKGVSFGALETKETIDRHSTSIDKLTSLVNKLDMKLDRQEAQYRPAVYQNRDRGCRQKQNNYGHRNRSYSQDRNQSYNRGRGNFHYNRGYRPHYRARSRSRNYGYGNGYRGNNNSQNYRRDNYRQDGGNQRYRNRDRSPSQDCSWSSQDIGAIPEITLEIDPMTEVKVGIEIGLAVERKDKGPEQNLETETEKVGLLQDLDVVPMLIPTGIDLDALELVNMTILQENQVQGQKILMTPLSKCYLKLKLHLSKTLTGRI